MDKIITARHFQLFDEIRDHVQGRLDQLEDEHGRLTSARVILDHQKSIFNAEITLRGRHIDIEARAEAFDLNLAFEAAWAKADKQLRRHYDKIKKHHRTPVSQLESESEEVLDTSA